MRSLKKKKYTVFIDQMHRARQKFLLLLLFMLCLLCLFIVSVSAVQDFNTGPDDFDWWIKDPPPSGSPNFKVRTTEYHFAIESDFPTWYSSASIPKGRSSCAIPKIQMGFYEAVRCEGDGITSDGKLVSWGSGTGISKSKETQTVFIDTSDESNRRRNRPFLRPKRSIAVNLKENTPCYIPRWSKVYIKYPEQNHPCTGWYIAEDTGGGFDGECKIDVFTGIGSAKYSTQGKSCTVSQRDPLSWPSIWVFPSTKSQDLYTENVFTFLRGKPGTGLVTSDIISTDYPTDYRPSHPFFSVDYSISPGFSISTDYDFNIYENIANQLKLLEMCKEDISCVVKKIHEIEQVSDLNWIAKYAGNVITKNSQNQSELVEWESFCEPENTNAVNSLAEAIDTCTSSPDSDCVCRYSLPVKEEDSKIMQYILIGLTSFFLGPALGIQEHLSIPEPWQKRIFTFKNINQSIKISLINPAFLSATVNSAEIYGVDKLEYFRSDFNKDILIYKKASNNLSVLPSNPQNLLIPDCKVHNKKVKFCVVQNNSFIAYDSTTKTVGSQRALVKFAYLFQGQITNVKNFMVSDVKKDYSSLLLSWDAVLSADVEKYTLYISDKSSIRSKTKDALTKKILSDANTIKELTLLDIPVSSRQLLAADFELTQTPTCALVYPAPTCMIMYSLFNPDSTMIIKQNQLYYSSRTQKFFYFLDTYADKPVLDNHDYFIGITAVDSTDAESPNIASPAKQEKSIDDIEPALPAFTTSTDKDNIIFSIIPPTLNIDNTTLDQKELNHFKLYCFSEAESKSSTLNQLSLSRKIPIKTVSASTLQITISKKELELSCSSKPYAIITASDKNNNEFKDQIDIKYFQSLTI